MHNAESARPPARLPPPAAPTSSLSCSFSSMRVGFRDSIRAETGAAAAKACRRPASTQEVQQATLQASCGYHEGVQRLAGLRCLLLLLAMVGNQGAPS